MNLTKANLIDSAHRQCGISKARSAELLEAILEIMKKTLERGEDLMISGFGKFCVKEKKDRRGRNPSTSEDLMLRARKVMVFKCSGVLRDRLNGERKG